MIRNFIKIAFRNLRRNKEFSILNITGLAIGMASAMLILLWVNNEMRFDNDYPFSDRLYQTWNVNKGNNGLHSWNNSPKILGPTLKKDFPEVERMSRVNYDATILFNTGEKKLNVTGTMVDPDFLFMFGFPLLKGNPDQALSEPDHIVVTEKLALQLFGTEDAMGRSIQLDNQYNFKVSGVMKDLPNTSEFHFEYLLPWSYMHTIHQDDSSWDRNSTHNFVLLKKNTNLVSFNKKIEGILREHGDKSWTTNVFLYPVSRLHLFGSFENGVESGGRIEMVRIFILIAGLILLIACINFMNMSTARSERRAKEVGIRKVSGALKKSLIIQFIAESVLVSLISGLLALLIVQLCLPAFNQLIQNSLLLPYNNVSFWLLFFGFVIFTGLIAGSYPAFFLSSFKPADVLKGSKIQRGSGINPRKILVVMQFSFAIIFIISTVIIRQQIQYAQNISAGYDKNKLMYVFLAGDMNKNYALIKQELISQGIAVSMTRTSAPLTERWSSGGADWTGKDPNERTGFDYFNSDANLVRTAGLQLTSGRDIDIDHFPSDSTAVLLNESAVRLMNFKNPLGQIINRGDNFDGWHVVGTVKNFVMESPYEPIGPMIIQGISGNWFNLVHIKLNDRQPVSSNIAAMEKIFRKYNPDYPFEYHFTDEQYEKKFNNDRLTGKLSGLFAGLTIFISCLGLFGLAAYMAEKRIKEIGVRKVLGASVGSIAGLLSKEFIVLVSISILVATPVSWWIMNKWLAGFTYHTSIAWWIFVAAGAVTVFIAVMTVSFQAVKAAMANPVISLRAE